MSVILGLNCYHADSSACIIKDGKLVAAIEEERINRIKHWAGFPIDSIYECIKIAKVSSVDITDVAINTNPKSNFFPKISFFLKNYLFKKKQSEIFTRLKKKISIKNLLLQNLNISNNIKVHYIDHHLSHISSAFFASGFENAIGLSIDGSGDFSSLLHVECTNQKFEVLDKVNFPDSLGIYYEGMTNFCGFKNFGDEYKLMGLAPYGNPKFKNLILNNIIDIDSNNFFRLNLEYFKHHLSSFEYKFNGKPNQNQIYSKKMLDLFKNYDNSSIEFKKDFAASTQYVFEKIFLNIVDKISNKKIDNNLVYAGGCALNSTANQKLIRSRKFKNIFIPYAPADNGGSIGAALFVNNSYKNKKLNVFSPYLGSSFSNEEVNKIINKNTNFDKKINYKFYENIDEINNLLVEIIIKNGVVGWFQGKMEFGPRALGNRSILADPRNPNMKDIINEKIKRREKFRPFAPSILQQFKNDWFEENFDN